jgi:hypothetical protein
MARRKAARREGARILNLSQIYSRYLAKNTIIPHSAGFILCLLVLTDISNLMDSYRARAKEIQSTINRAI